MRLGNASRWTYNTRKELNVTIGTYGVPGRHPGTAQALERWLTHLERHAGNHHIGASVASSLARSAHVYPLCSFFFQMVASRGG